METAVTDEMLRQRDANPNAVVEASPAGWIGKVFEELGSRVAEVKSDNIAVAAALSGRVAASGRPGRLHHRFELAGSREPKSVLLSLGAAFWPSLSAAVPLDFDTQPCSSAPSHSVGRTYRGNRGNRE